MVATFWVEADTTFRPALWAQVCGTALFFLPALLPWAVVNVKIVWRQYGGSTVSSWNLGLFAAYSFPKCSSRAACFMTRSWLLRRPRLPAL